MMLHKSEERIFQIKFRDRIEELATQYSDIDPYDHLLISLIPTQGCFDFQNDTNEYISYMIIREDNIKQYEKIMKRNGIKITVEDKSLQVLRNEINLQDELRFYAKDYNTEPYHNFTEQVNQWISERLSPDDVLDMINERGVNSLGEIHKKILQGI